MQAETYSEPQSSDPRKRHKTKRPGIYWRETAGGKRYIVTFRDRDGKQHWRSDPSWKLEDALAALDALRGGVRRDEQVASSRATFSEVAALFLDAQSHLRPRTLENYRSAVRLRLGPHFGRKRIGAIDVEDVAALIAEMRRDGLAPWTIKGTITPLSRIFAWAERRGYVAANPVRKLERSERPSAGRREMRLLTAEELGRLLDAANPRYRPLLATAAFTGLRLGELLGLRWRDVDFDAGVLHVRNQLGRDGKLVEPKMRQAVRDVVLAPRLGTILREQKLSLPPEHTSDEGYVFPSTAGTPLYWRNVSARGLDKAARKAGLGEWRQDDDGKRRWKSAVRMHDLRHYFASLMISQGLNVVFVSRQLGHASPKITLDVYAHLFDAAEHSKRASDALDAALGNAQPGNSVGTRPPVSGAGVAVVASGHPGRRS